MSPNGHHPDTNGRDPLRADEWLEARHAASREQTSPFARGRSTQPPPPPYPTPSALMISAAGMIMRPLCTTGSPYTASTVPASKNRSSASAVYSALAAAL